MLRQIAPIILIFCVALPQATAQFSAGSDGSDGPLIVNASINLPLDEDGIFHFTTVDIAAGATLSFTPNDANAPVVILSSGDINISGTIDVSGRPGNSRTGGLGGPGGFEGGMPGAPGLVPGDGHGPGGGKAYNGLCISSSFPGSGSFGHSRNHSNGLDGETYGTSLLVPLIGGSGGGGSSNIGGGGGGGAILLAADTKITIPSGGAILAAGGYNNNCNNMGSGGAVRLVSPVVSGYGQISVSGGGYGRIRIDLIDRSQFSIYLGNYPRRLGSFMTVFPEVTPTLNFLDVAGTSIPEGQSGPVEIILPFNSSTTQIVRIQAKDFLGVVPIRIALTPESGSVTYYDVDVDMTTANPAVIDVEVEFPQNVPVRVHAWTR